MKYQNPVLISLLAVASATPVKVTKREVPQEQSHNIYLEIVREFLNLDNPLGIVDPVFGLLGNAAAAAGVADPTSINLDCLKQLTADQAFTNAKAISDVRGMAGALVYQALERNTGKVGLESVICPEDAVNPEIAAFDQHQDPAAPGAQAGNKAVALALAEQLALIGVDPLIALDSGTFAPGDPNDNTGAGNTCDTQNALPGCIFSDRLLVLDASPQEILAAVVDITPTFTGTGVIEATNIDFNGLPIAGGGVATLDGAVASAAPTATGGAKQKCNLTGTAGGAVKTAAPAVSTQSCSVVTRTIPNCAARTTAASAVETGSATAEGVNVQAFSGTLGGPPPRSSRPRSAAIGRSCDIQKNACANAANSGALAGGVGQCETQLAACRSANALRKRQSAFGSCGDPSIEFGQGFDGRKEGSFRPVNGADFNHGSAQKIGIIASFICDRLSSSCKADASTVATCKDAAAKAGAATQDATAASVFNSALTGAAAGEAVPATKPKPAKPAVTKTAKAGAAASATGGSIVVTVTQCS
ncbi:related to cell wall mannoprotein [Cephalotrichum gorgonifer]|uniref:Related to cell wall mannoprotein n=1 Tax=Cephalotrichum gorgonifer TaxID=2041049 RepID=A0AAE8N0D8_9PEZI|nr:related to cell wall mannoprotein [Cephalotrichum gorgonifer]